jgi:hypothetical protein
MTLNCEGFELKLELLSQNDERLWISPEPFGRFAVELYSWLNCSIVAIQQASEAA